MLECLASLKTVIDIINDGLQAKKSLRSDKNIFDEVVTPVYNNMSKS